MKELQETLMNDPLEVRYIKLKEILKEHGIRVSHQRLLILDYMVCNEIHPTADEIYKNLKSKDPVLSQATVYNTLNLFVQNNILSELDFNQPSKRYDFYRKRHSHFICENCGKIVDLYLDLEEIDLKQLDGYKINSMDIIVRGQCPECIQKK
jgi:Fur family peroxide stress response transcriptional regulator